MKRDIAAVLLSAAVHGVIFASAGAPSPAKPEAPVIRVSLREIPKPAPAVTPPPQSVPAKEPAPAKQPEKPVPPKPSPPKRETPKPKPRMPEKHAEPIKREPPAEPPMASAPAGPVENAAPRGSDAPPHSGAAEETSRVPAAPSIVDVSSLRVIKKVQPSYPMISRKRGDQGTVTLLVTIVSGSVKSAKVETSSGHAPLDESALQAARGWKFDISEENTMIARIPFVFSLR